MSLPNPKELKKLAALCRKLGISHYKSSEYEFTLGELPHKSTQVKAKKTGPAPAESDGVASDYSSDSLTQEQLLLWSTGEPEQDEGIQ